MEKNKIKSFTDLNVWKEGHRLVLAVYKLTRHFPKEETFGLASQMRRAAVSITSNIAEGFARSGKKEKVQFYYMALGSLSELQNQVLVARDLSYLSVEEFNNLANQTITVNKLVNGFIKSARSRFLTR